MKLRQSVDGQFRRHGRAGGRKRAARLSTASRKAIAQRGARARWIRARFGESSFAALGVPGGELVDAGLVHLAAGQATIESLLISLAAPRFHREGVPLGTTAILQDPEDRLYDLLAKSSGDLAHARYTAYLRVAASFADALAMLRFHPKRRAR